MGGHDAHKGCRHSVKNEDRIEDLWVASEFRSPEVVVHDKNRRSAGAAVFGEEGSAEERGDAQKVEGVGGYQLAERPVANGLAVVVLKADTVVDDGFFEDVILFAEGANFVGEEEVAAFPAPDVGEILHFEDDEAIGILVWESIDEDAKDDAEHDGASADAESQGDDGDEGEGAICCEGAEA